MQSARLRVIFDDLRLVAVAKTLLDYWLDLAGSISFWHTFRVKELLACQIDHLPIHLAIQWVHDLSVCLLTNQLFSFYWINILLVRDFHKGSSRKHTPIGAEMVFRCRGWGQASYKFSSQPTPVAVATKVVAKCGHTVVGWMSSRPGLDLGRADRRDREWWADGVARSRLDLLARCG